MDLVASFSISSPPSPSPSPSSHFLLPPFPSSPSPSPSSFLDPSVIASSALDHSSLSSHFSSFFNPAQVFLRRSSPDGESLPPARHRSSSKLHSLALAMLGDASSPTMLDARITNWWQTLNQNTKYTMLCSISPSFSQEILASSGDGGSKGNGDGSGGGGGGGGDEDEDASAGGDGGGGAGGILGAFLNGWRDRVRTDPQFPYKVLMEEVVGVGACVLGDMASRPNFGLNELDFVFSTLVVGSIVNFALMYLLASTGNASLLPGVFGSCPPGHMFEPGAYSIIDRAGTFVYKAGVFAGVGFASGLLGTAISTLLLQTRKKLDPDFVPQNKPPPTILNAATWALHMGVSSNFRYQALNGLEFSLANVLNPAAFKASVIVTRALNNVIGGTSFVLLARLTGSQKAATDSSTKDSEEESKLLDEAAIFEKNGIATEKALESNTNNDSRG